ncbi:hypothetical protein BJ170DRAFT_145581 [Xylariales sp. AK1849]|nr:hypothetical protein BJ170DRAFT_145581 [Xylariales sp. AK1849]
MTKGPGSQLVTSGANRRYCHAADTSTDALRVTRRPGFRKGLGMYVVTLHTRESGGEEGARAVRGPSISCECSAGQVETPGGESKHRSKLNSGHSQGRVTLSIRCWSKRQSPLNGLFKLSASRTNALQFSYSMPANKVPKDRTTQTRWFEWRGHRFTCTLRYEIGLCMYLHVRSSLLQRMDALVDENANLVSIESQVAPLYSEEA